MIYLGWMDIQICLFEMSVIPQAEVRFTCLNTVVQLKT
jgi:hypothetical protein